MARSSQTFESLVATRVELLVDALGTATRVAECLGVTRPLLSKWRAGTVMPTPAQAKLLVDLDHVVARGSSTSPRSSMSGCLVATPISRELVPLTCCISEDLPMCWPHSMLSSRRRGAASGGVQPDVVQGLSRFNGRRCHLPTKTQSQDSQAAVAQCLIYLGEGQIPHAPQTTGTSRVMAP